MSFNNPWPSSAPYTEGGDNGGGGGDNVSDTLLTLQTSLSKARGQIEELTLTPSQSNLRAVKAIVEGSTHLIARTQDTILKWKHDNDAPYDSSDMSRRKILEEQLEACFAAEVHQFREAERRANAAFRGTTGGGNRLYESTSYPCPLSTQTAAAVMDRGSDPDDMIVLMGGPTGPDGTTSLEGGGTGDDLLTDVPLGFPEFVPPPPAEGPSAKGASRGSLPLPPPTLPTAASFYDTADISDTIGALPQYHRAQPQQQRQSSCSSGRSEESGRISPCGSSQGSTAATLNTPPPPQTATFGVATGQTTDTSDGFLQDDYAHRRHQKDAGRQQQSAGAAAAAEDDDDDQELASLLARRSTDPRVSSCLEGWEVVADPHPDNLQTYISRERAVGMDRIRRQAAQLFQVFREFNHLIHEQQDDLDLLSDTMVHVKASTGNAIDELHKANKRKREARRRNFFFIGITVVIALIILLVYTLQNGSSGPVMVLAASPPTFLATQQQHPPPDIPQPPRALPEQTPSGVSWRPHMYHRSPNQPARQSHPPEPHDLDFADKRQPKIDG